MCSPGEIDRKRAGVMVSSDDIEAAGAWFARPRVGDRGSGVTSLTIVIEGSIAVTIVALSNVSFRPHIALSQNSRRTSTQTEEHPRKQQLRVHVLCLHEHP